MQAEAKAVAHTVNKHIRIDEELWQRLEEAARELDTTANRLLAELAQRWLEKRAWPTTEAEVQIARASLFAAQVLGHDMMAAGRGQEIDEWARGGRWSVVEGRRRCRRKGRRRTDGASGCGAKGTRVNVTRPFRKPATSAAPLFTRPGPAPLRVQRMRSPARNSMVSAR